jgi:CRP-like cAMP-binding protein
MYSLTLSATATAQNELLAALPAAKWQRVREIFKLVFMPRGDVLYEPGMNINHIYFPTTSVISISSVMADGRADAVTLIGSEGFAGVEAILGGNSGPCRAVVIGEGWGYRVRREWLSEKCGRVDSMLGVLLRYTQSHLTQVAQTAVCNRHHSIDRQLCRWLLMFLDRQAPGNLVLTQEQIADLMGVRRESITNAAHKLQMAGFIRYQRGLIHAVDRNGLEAHACECYTVCKRETDRLLAISQRGIGATATLSAADGARIEQPSYAPMSGSPSVA